MNSHCAGVLESHLLPRLSGLLLSFLLGLWVVPPLALGDPVAALPQVGGYTLVSKRLLSRLEYELTYTAQLTNPGPALQDVKATLTVQATGVTVQDGTLDFGDIPAHTVVPSRDTFQVRHDRRHTFREADLAWTVTSLPGNTLPVANAGPDQTALVGDRAGAPEEPVTVTFQPHTAGAFLGTITVQSNAGTAEVTLQGVGEPPPVAKTRIYFIHNDPLGTPQFLTDEQGTEV
jgi:hypothetical protein